MKYVVPKWETAFSSTLGKYRILSQLRGRSLTTSTRRGTLVVLEMSMLCRFLHQCQLGVSKQVVSYGQNLVNIVKERHPISWMNARKYAENTKWYIASSGPFRILVLFLEITFHNAARIFHQVQISKASILKRSEKLSKNLACLYYFVIPYYM